MLTPNVVEGLTFRYLFKSRRRCAGGYKRLAPTPVTQAPPALQGGDHHLLEFFKFVII
jgi:hypothetical protein